MCGKTACTVRRAGRARALSDPYAQPLQRAPEAGTDTHKRHERPAYIALQYASAAPARVALAHRPRGSTCRGTPVTETRRGPMEPSCPHGAPPESAVLRVVLTSTIRQADEARLAARAALMQRLGLLD